MWINVWAAGKAVIPSSITRATCIASIIKFYRDYSGFAKTLAQDERSDRQG